MCCASSLDMRVALWNHSFHNPEISTLEQHVGNFVEGALQFVMEGGQYHISAGLWFWYGA